MYEERLIMDAASCNLRAALGLYLQAFNAQHPTRAASMVSASLEQDARSDIAGVACAFSEQIQLDERQL
jgi:hypothetical protein